jgi:hypothetical protein
MRENRRVISGIEQDASPAVLDERREAPVFLQGRGRAEGVVENRDACRLLRIGLKRSHDEREGHEKEHEPSRRINHVDGLYDLPESRLRHRPPPSTAPEDHPIHDAAEAGELACVRAFSSSSHRSFTTSTVLGVILCTVRPSGQRDSTPSIVISVKGP